MSRKVGKKTKEEIEGVSRTDREKKLEKMIEKTLEYEHQSNRARIEFLKSRYTSLKD